MDVHIDWLSFTLETPVEPTDLADLYHIAKGVINDDAKEMGKGIFNGKGFEAGPSRPPYALALLREDHGCAIYGRSHTSTILVELSGRGCEYFRQPTFAYEHLAPIAERVTRLDIAGDVRTDTRPADFCNERENDRFRSISFIRSDAGETVYVGSAKSDRFCRVYRYNPPHPRSDLLRCEFVLRRGYSKTAVLDIVEADGLETYIARLGNSWGFRHRDWQPSVQTEERAQAPIVTRRDEDTVRWLYSQCVPAIRRCLMTGALDFAEFVETIYDQS